MRTKRPILLVEDDRVDVMTVKRSLKEIKVANRLDIVGNGEEALDHYKTALKEGEPFDVVIMDLTVQGGMGGQEAMRHLLEIDPDVTAVVSSGYSEDPVMANYREHGFAAFILKPFRLRDLSQTLEKLL